jgi:putative acyl-CoA dehydrogenase
LYGHNAALNDVVLVEALVREGAAWAADDVVALGARVGDPEVIALGELANTYPPMLCAFDRFGHRIDEVDYHPAYHHLMAEAVANGLHTGPWSDGRPGAHVARAAKVALWTQVEAGHVCPISMTYSVLPSLREQPDVAAEWEPALLSSLYDPRCLPSPAKRGVLAGMALTEKQGGSDVQANTTAATPIGAGGPGGEYLLTGHKWFCSAPMSDLVLVTARTTEGLGCFALPKWRPDETRNAIHIQRLKDKLGNKSNASSEIELDAAWGRLVGDDGQGVRTIIAMINHTRLDCVIGVTGQMRAGLSQAIHHAQHRSAFGRCLIEQPLMAAVLTDLAIESEAATTLMMRLARSWDNDATEADEAFRRLATTVAKYWVCKRAPMFAAEALECLFGSGYVEESPMARLFRESPLNGIWEGSGNVMCLDVLRAIQRAPDSLVAVMAEINEGRGADSHLDRAMTDLQAELADRDSIEARSRGVVERIALVLQGSLLVRFAPSAVADAFCATRLGDEGGRAFGTLPRSVDVGAILRRAWPDQGT